jgi:hypothetical protein
MSIEAVNFFNDHRVAALGARAWFIGSDTDHVAVKVRTADWFWLVENDYDPEEFDGGHKCTEPITEEMMSDCPVCVKKTVTGQGGVNYGKPWIDADGNCGRCSGTKQIRVGTRTIGEKLAEGAEDREYFPFRVVAFPCVKVNCSTCDGKGTHVNPSIDAGGISGSDWDEDPDFQDQYMSGMYDVQCYGCKGAKTVPSINVKAMGPEDTKIYTSWRTWQDQIEREEDAYRAERAAEIRWGC